MHALRPQSFEYDIAVSYASENGAYVEEVAKRLERKGVQIFYAPFKEAELFGQDLYTYLDKVYRQEARFCLMFISKAYGKKLWTNHEMRSAQARAFAENREYILPARFDDTDIPGIRPTLGYIDLRKKTPAQAAAVVLQKLSSSNPQKPKGSSTSTKRPRKKSSAAPSGPFNNLPGFLTRFVGRKDEVARVEELLHQATIRLVVLHGPGGTGKTRLAHYIAGRLGGEYRDGTCMTFLEQISTPAMVASAIAKDLRVKEVEGTPVIESLKQFLEDKEMLLVLDHFEHVVPAGKQLVGLLEGCPGIKLLVTSRRLLAIRGARNFQVPPLEVPPEVDRLTPDEVARYDAVKLFGESALTVDPDFKVNQDNAHEVAKIVRSLEGLALAIELTAVRVHWYPPPEMLRRLNKSLKLVAGEEQDKLIQASIASSYKLLNRAEKALFRRLSVFSGGCTVEEAEKVCNALGDLGIDIEQGLESLADNNLLRRDRREIGHPRFFMMEMIRNYAQESLHKQEFERLRRAHTQVYLELAEEADAKLKTASRAEFLERLKAEHDNVRAALAWCGTEGGDRDLGLRLAGALFWFWNLGAHFSEGRAWLDRVLGKGSTAGPARARALYAAGGLAFLQGDYTRARQLLEESATLWRSLQNRRDLGYTLITLGMTALGENDFDAALANEEESVEIFREVKDQWGLALSLNDLGNVQRRMGNHGAARVLYEQSLEIWQVVNDTWGLPLTLSNLGFLHMVGEDFNAARSALERALEIQKTVEDKWGRAETLKYLGDLAVRQGDYSEAERRYLESLEWNKEIGRKQFMVGCVAGLAVVAARVGREELAVRLFGAADSLRNHHQVSARILDYDMFKKTMTEVSLRLTKKFEKARKEGQAMELPQAAAYALELFASES